MWVYVGVSISVNVCDEQCVWQCVLVLCVLFLL